jgi:hypothetical protein
VPVFPRWAHSIHTDADGGEINALASSIAFRVIVSASPSSIASIATVALFREPLGRPAGLPDWPGGNRTPRCFGPVLLAAITMFCFMWLLDSEQLDIEINSFRGRND